MRTRTWIWSSVAAVIVLAILFFGFRNGGFFRKTTAKSSTTQTQPKVKRVGSTCLVDSLYLENLKKNEQTLRNCCDRANLLDKQLAEQQVILKKSNDSIIILDYELRKCQAKKAVVIVRTQQQEKKPDPPKKNSSEITGKGSADLTAKNAFKPDNPANPQMSNSYKTALDGSEFIGLKDGDFYITISTDGFLQYAFAKKLYDQSKGKGTPEFNNKGSGKKFELDGDEYVYVDKEAPATVDALNHNYSWTVYIGDGDGYPKYMPHELIKPMIVKARGDLAGTISEEDVTKIGELVPEVKARRILPNTVTATGDYDGKKYEGWRFVTKVMFEQKVKK